MIENKECNILDSDCNIICQSVNCQGVMNSGLAKEIRMRYPDVFPTYEMLCNKDHSNMLGKVYFHSLKNDQIIANLFSQDKYGTDRRYTNYAEMFRCLDKVERFARQHNFSVSIPYGIGCGLGGGNWKSVSCIIKFIFGNSTVKCKICKRRDIK
jgi:O-acetyl-ADP-ribose deacetylase (regulator of RNase III)